MAAKDVIGRRREVGEWRNWEGEEQVNSSELCSAVEAIGVGVG